MSQQIRGEKRPTDPAKAARWDAIGIVWHDKEHDVQQSLVTECIEKFGTLITSFRTQIKENSNKIDAATTQPVKLPELQLERKVLLDSLHEIINAANEFGYDLLVVNLGKNQKLVHGLTSTLFDCFKADDFNGPLPKAVFTLLARFQTLTDDFLKKLKFDGLQKKWLKKGDDEIKGLIVKILANTVDAKEKEQAARAKELNTSKLEADRKSRIPASQVKKPIVNPGVSNPAKRPSVGSIGNEPPAKKVDPKHSGIATTTSKPAAPKLPLSSLLGMAHKPAPKPKKRELSPPSTSMFGALMASIEKPPEPPKAPETSKSKPEKPETQEERVRRERKASRAHLRVRFKEGDALEEIKLFKHEQAEDEGRQDGMLRDAHDTHHENEGAMHRLRVVEAVDDEEEYQPPDVEDPYTEPKAINLELVSKVTPRGPNYVTNAGVVPISSYEQKSQAQREAHEQMGVYTNPKDIPSSPTELSVGFDLKFQRQSDLQPPTDPVVAQRVHSQQDAFQNSHSFRNSRESFATIPTQIVNTTLPTLSGQPSSQAQDQSVLMDKKQEALAIFNNIQDIIGRNGLRGKPFPAKQPPLWMQNQKDRAPWIAGYNRDHPNSPVVDDQLLPKAGEHQQAVSYNLSPPAMAPQFQAQFPQLAAFHTAPPVPQQSLANPQYSTNPNGIADILARLTNNQSLPPPPPVSQQPHTNPHHLDATQQVLDILAGKAQAFPPPPPPPPAAGQPFDYTQWFAQLQGNGNQAMPYSNPQPQVGVSNYNTSQANSSYLPSHQAETANFENRNTGEKYKSRWDDRGDSWSNTNANEQYEDAKKKQSGAGQKKSKRKAGGLFDENGEYMGKKMPCKFYQLGQCTKGKNCTYLHEDNH